MIRYFDMFAGIGGFRAGLTRAGGFQCVGHCEIDKYADRSYRAMHDIQPEEYFCPDAKAMKSCEIPDFDLICGGFPCQSYPEEMAIPKKWLKPLRRKGLRPISSG